MKTEQKFSIFLIFLKQLIKVQPYIVTWALDVGEWRYLRLLHLEEDKKKTEMKPDEMKGERREKYTDLLLRSSLILFTTHLTWAINSKR